MKQFGLGFLIFFVCIHVQASEWDLFSFGVEGPDAKRSLFKEDQQWRAIVNAYRSRATSSVEQPHFNFSLLLADLRSEAILFDRQRNTADQQAKKNPEKCLPDNQARVILGQIREPRIISLCLSSLQDRNFYEKITAYYDFVFGEGSLVGVLPRRNKE